MSCPELRYRQLAYASVMCKATIGLICPLRLGPIHVQAIPTVAHLWHSKATTPRLLLVASSAKIAPTKWIGN
ncbi:hypothetical protein M3J09_007235 [Ascochyta lentis]